MYKIPVTDNHIHVDPINGDGPIEIANKFNRAGGSFMIVPNKPTWTVSENCSFKESMELVIEYVNEINKCYTSHSLCSCWCPSCRIITQN